MPLSAAYARIHGVPTVAPLLLLLLLLPRLPLLPEQQYALTIVEGARSQSNPVALVLESLHDLQGEAVDAVKLSFGFSSALFSRCLLLTLG